MPGTGRWRRPARPAGRPSWRRSWSPASPTLCRVGLGGGRTKRGQCEAQLRPLLGWQRRAVQEQSVAERQPAPASIKHLAVNRRRISPTAMGRTPPAGLGSATRLAPARLGATAGQAWPCASKLTTPQSCCSKASADPAAQASRRCWTRRPDGPAAVSAGKLRNALAMASGTSTGAKGWAASGRVVGGGWAGWSAWRACVVAAVCGQSPCESKALQAFPVEALPCQCCGETALLRGAGLFMVPPAKWTTGVPKALPFAMLPLVKAIQRVGGTGFGMLPSPAWRDAQDTAGQHQEFSPRLLIIVVHKLRPRSGRGSGSTNGGHCAAHGEGFGVPPCWNFLESREPSLGLLWGSLWGGSPECRVTSGMYTVADWHAKATYQTSRPPLGLEPILRDIALQGAS